MNTVMNVIKMDMAICRKPIVLMVSGMLAAGVGCLFFLSPLLLGFFVVGSTAVVSVIFSVESKSNMEFFYGCLPIQKWQYILGRSLTCLSIMAVPSVISIAFVQIGMRFSLCRVEEMRILMKVTSPYQMTIICALIMLGFIGGANLLLASFAGKIESREILEVLLLLAEGVLVGIIMFFIQKIIYHGDQQAFTTSLLKMLSDNELLCCILFLCTGLFVFAVCTVISLKIATKKCRCR